MKRFTNRNLGLSPSYCSTAVRNEPRFLKGEVAYDPSSRAATLFHRASFPLSLPRLRNVYLLDTCHMHK